MGFLDTKLEKFREDSFIRRLALRWPFIANSSDLCKGRILLTWDDSVVQVLVTHNTRQFIHVIVQSLNSPCKFEATFVYASNDRVERSQLWGAVRDCNFCWCAMECAGRF